MSELLTLIRVGDTPRMESLLHKALSGIPYEEASPQNQALHNRRILFVVGIEIKALERTFTVSSAGCAAGPTA